MTTADLTRCHAAPETLAHLAELLHQVRPDWEPTLIKVVLINHADRVALDDLTIAAMRCAQNVDYPTPKAIMWRGRHWDGLATVPPEIAPAQRCDVCGKTEPRCYGERVGVDDDHAFVPVTRRVAS